VDRTYRCPACDSPNFVTELRLFRAGDEPLACWKCNAFVDHKTIRFDTVRENRHQQLMGRPVEMIANGILYKGTFVEMTDEDVKLRGPTGWIIIPTAKVSSVKEAGVKPPFPRQEKSVDSSFYDPLLDDPDEDG
jgi:hypothetical protein